MRAWKDYTDQWGNKFPDGESYSLQYPEVTLPKEAVYVYNQGYQIPKDYEVRLESTIGIYGAGLLDAITDEDIKAQYAKEEKAGASVNPAIFKDGEWVKQYANSLQGNGEKHPLRYTYALSRGPLLDGPGSNAMSLTPSIKPTLESRNILMDERKMNRLMIRPVIVSSTGTLKTNVKVSPTNTPAEMITSLRMVGLPIPGMSPYYR